MALDKKIFYVCIGLGGAVIWLCVFKTGFVAKPLLLVFFSVVSLTFVLTAVSVLLNLSAYRKEKEAGRVSAKRDGFITAVRSLYIIGIIASLVLAILIYAFNI